MSLLFQPLEGFRFAVLGGAPSAEFARELLADLGAAVAGSDVDGVIEDRCGGEGPAGAIDVAAPRVVVSPFGQTGPDSEYRATPFTLDAASGLVRSVNAIGDPYPALLTPQSSGAVGTAAVLALLSAMDAKTHGEPCRLDLSAQEAVLAQGPLLEMTHLLGRCPGAPGSSRFGVPTGWYRCREDWVLVLGVEEQQRQSLLAFLRSDAIVELVGVTVETYDDAADSLRRLCSKWTAREVESALQDCGVPVSRAQSAAELVTDPHTEQRGALTVDGTVHRAPAVVCSQTEKEQVGGLRGLRVTEVGSLIAAPLAGAILGALGADVRRWEDIERPDGYRRNGPFINGEKHVDNAAYFAAVNHSTTNVSVENLKTSPKLREAIASTDVFLSNLGVSTEDKWRLDPESLGQISNGLAITSSGYGRGGARDEFRAYAYNIHAYGGVAVPEAGADPVEVNTALADMATAYSVATLIAAWAVGGRRTASVLDLSMAETIAARILRRDASQDTQSRVDDLVVPCTSGDFVAVAAHGQDPLLDELRAAAANRVPVEHDARELVARLQRAGFAAAVAHNAASLIEDPHLAARDFFVPVTHPVDDGLRIAGLPWLSNGRRPDVGAIPSMRRNNKL